MKKYIATGNHKFNGGEIWCDPKSSIKTIILTATQWARIAVQCPDQFFGKGYQALPHYDHIDFYQSIPQIQSFAFFV